MLNGVPAPPRKTLVYDQGKAMSEYKSLTGGGHAGVARRVLCGPAQPLAVRLKREHQCTAPPQYLREGTDWPGYKLGRSQCDRQAAQYPSSQT